MFANMACKHVNAFVKLVNTFVTRACNAFVVNVFDKGSM